VSFRRSDNATDTWSIGRLVRTDRIITVLNYEEGGGGWRCAHSLTSHRNVVIDVDACGQGATAEDSIAIVNRILQKMPS
jgi:hypothetical protein